MHDKHCKLGCHDLLTLRLTCIFQEITLKLLFRYCSSSLRHAYKQRQAACNEETAMLFNYIYVMLETHKAYLREA